MSVHSGDIIEMSTSGPADTTVAAQCRPELSDEEPQAKRARTRASHACEACRRRRSRCEPLTGGGCHRCKQLQTDCSFASDNGGNRGSIASEVPRTTESIQDSVSGPSIRADSFRQSNTYSSQPPTHPSSMRTPSLTDIATLQHRISQLEAALSQSVGSLQSPTSMLASTFSASQDQRHDPIADISLQSETHGLHVAPNIPSSPTNHITTPGQSSATRTTGQGAPGPRFQGWYRSLADPETYGLIHRGMMTRTHEGLRDPIEAGVITEGQAEVAFQIFKHHFAAVFPHPHFLRVRSKLPSHPFLRSACLFYTTRCSSHISIFNPAQVRRLETNLIDNINAYHYGCPPSFEGVMAAYILSLIPHDWTENSTGQPELEPTRTAGLAYGQAREIGSVNFERLLQTLRSGMPLKLIEDRVNQARLHLGVITRHLWLTISRCPWSVVSPLVHQTQRELLDFLLQSDSHSEVDQHVDVEYACLETIMKFSATWRQLETVETPMSAEVRSSTDIVRRLGREFDELRSKTAVSYDGLVSLPYLLCHISYCKWWVAARNVWFIYRLPTPILTAEVIDAWLDGMTEGLRTATEFIRQCLAEKWDLTTIPKACGTALVLSVLAISTGIIHYKHHFPELLLPGELDIEGVLREMQDYLSRCGHGLTMMLERSQENLEEYRIQILNQLVADDEYRYLVPENNVFGSQVDNEPGSGSGVLDLFSGLDTWWNWQLPQQPTADDNGPPAFLY